VPLVFAGSPASPTSSVASGAAVAVSFAPEENCADFADRAIGNAEREILVGAYGLTTGAGIVEALVRAKERGVDVRLIADKNTPCEGASGIEPLAAAGVPIWIDDARPDRARQNDGDRRRRHTDGFDELDPRRPANSEDLNLVSSSEVAAAYAAHWRERLALSVRFRSPRGLVPGFAAGSALMRQGRPPSRSLRAQGLCKVTVLVPEDCAEGIRQFARELGAR
jgi:hypothetical protein